MRLNRNLYDEALTRACDFCGHELIKPGRWFASLRGSFTCESCFQRNSFGYEAKSRLFHKSAQKLLQQIERKIDRPERRGN